MPSIVGKQFRHLPKVLLYYLVCSLGIGLNLSEKITEIPHDGAQIWGGPNSMETNEPTIVAYTQVREDFRCPLGDSNDETALLACHANIYLIIIRSLGLFTNISTLALSLSYMTTRGIYFGAIFGSQIPRNVSTSLRPFFNWRRNY